MDLKNQAQVKYQVLSHLLEVKEVKVRYLIRKLKIEYLIHQKAIDQAKWLNKLIKKVYQKMIL